jgi:hypothetical protein
MAGKGRDHSVRSIILPLVFALCASAAFAQPRAREKFTLAETNSSFLIKMNTSIGTTSSKVGDAVTGQVIDPVSARGGTVEGTVDRADHAILGFSFHTLRLDGKSYPVQSRIVSLTSSAGNEGRDDLDNRVRIEGAGIIAFGTAVAVNEGAEVRMTIWRK